MKICNSCKEEKELIDFGNQKTAKDGLCPTCRECRKEQGRKHRKRNSDYDRKYRAENKEHTDAVTKKWRDDNKDKQAMYKSQWAKMSRDTRREVEREYRKSEKGRVVSTVKQHKRDKRINYTDDGTVTTEALLQLKEEQDNKCYHCGEALDYETPRAIHLDHLVPLVKGGQHTLSNVRWSCAYCNLSKGAKLT